MVGVKILSEEVPSDFKLYRNYPNPFNPFTKIKFEISLNPQATPRTELVVYDFLGREVAILVNERLNPGTYEAEFDGTNYASGVYLYKLTNGNYSETKRFTLIK